MTEDSDMTAPLDDMTYLRLAAVALGFLAAGDEWGKRHAQIMGDTIGIAARTVERWANGTRTVPPAVWHDIANKARDQSNQLIKLATQLDQRSHQQQSPFVSRDLKADNPFVSRI